MEIKIWLLSTPQLKPLSILIANGDGTFQPQVIQSLGGEFPVAGGQLTIGDFNGDGNLDLAVVCSDNPSLAGVKLCVLLGNGDGTFRVQSITQISSSATGAAIASADFNRDGKLDLLLNCSPSCGILLGNGDGTFQAIRSVPLTNSGGDAFAVGDFNGDGRLDLAFEVAIPPADTASNFFAVVVLGNGDGTFQAQQQIPATVGTFPGTISAHDFNGDGKLDLILINGSTTVHTLLGNGDGTFASTEQAPIASGGFPIPWVAVGDFNQDGKLDIIGSASSGFGSDYFMCLGNGDGTFQTQLISTDGNGSGANISVGDFNGDGAPDFAISNGHFNTEDIFLNNFTATATATLSGVSVSGGGTHNVDATYPGTGVYKPSTSGTVPLIGTSIPTTLALSVAPGTSVPGQQVALTAILSPSSEGSFQTNGEAISFTSNGIPLGSASLSSGAATLFTTSLAVGSDSLTATYNGDGDFLASSGHASIVVKTNPSLSVSCSPNPITFGPQTTTCTAHVSSGGGTISLFIDGSFWLTGNVDGSGNVSGSGFNFFAAGNHTILGNYSGDPNNNIASGSTVLTILPAPTTTVVVSTLDPSTVGQIVAWPCTVTSSAGIPTGTIVYTDNGNVVATSTVPGGAPWSSTGLPVGTHLIGCSFAPQGNFAASSSSVVQIVKNASTVVLTSTPASLFVGETAVLSAQVTSGATGTVTFAIEGNQVGVVVLDGSALAVLPGQFAGMPIGTYGMTATYSGDANFSPSSTSGTMSITSAATVTELSSSNNPIFFEGSTTFTALIDTRGNSPTGSVIFSSNGTSIGSAPVTSVTTTNLLNNSDVSTWSLSSAGAAPPPTVTPNAFAAPDGTMTATHLVYPALAACCENAAMTSTVAWIPGQQYIFSVWLRSDTNAQISMSLRTGAGGETDIQPTLTPIWTRYSVTGTVPAGFTGNVNVLLFTQFTGTSDFYAWGAQVEQATSVGPYIATHGAVATASGGIATLTTSSLPTGSDTILASYVGDPNDLPSTSLPLVETVNKDTSTVSLTASPNPSTFGNTVVLTATVPTGATGTVQFLDGSTLIGSTVISGTTASVSTRGLTAGSHSITAVYSGDLNNTGATSPIVIELVNKATPTITWANPADITYGTGLSATQLDATASVPGTFVYSPTAGTILGAGTHTLSVTFTPTDATDYNQAMGTAALTVNKAVPTISWPNPSSITYGTALTGTQLNAIASVPGTFIYSPVAGTILKAGTQTLSVSFTPTDGADYSAATATATLVVSKAAVIGSVTSSLNPATFSLSVTLTFTYKGVPGLPGPTGSISVVDGGNAIVTLPLNSAGVATFTTSDLAVGSHGLVVTYGGDANYQD